MTNKIIVLTILIFLFTTNTNANNYGALHQDTIRIQMPDGMTIESHTTNSNKHYLARNLNCNDEINSFLKHWETLNVKDLNPNKSVHITYYWPKMFTSAQHRISIKEMPIKKNIYFPRDTTTALLIQGNHKLILNNRINIYFTKISQLRDLGSVDLNKLTSNIYDAFQKSKPISKNEIPIMTWIKVEGKNSAKIIFQHSLTTKTPGLFTGELIAGAALGNIKGNWNGSFDVSIGIMRPIAPKYSFTLGYSWMYDFSSGQRNINHWACLGYARKISFMNRKAKWLSMSLGYLVKRKGDLFEKDSFRISINKKINKNISVVPQIYFHDFFKDAYPGFKIKIHL